jgi:hypothetical protein
MFPVPKIKIKHLRSVARMRRLVRNFLSAATTHKCRLLTHIAGRKGVAVLFHALLCDHEHEMNGLSGGRKMQTQRYRAKSIGSEG